MHIIIKTIYNRLISHKSLICCEIQRSCVYNVFRQVIPRINDQCKERVFVAIYDGNFHIELIIVVGSSSITLSKFNKVRKRKAIYSKKLSCSIVLEIRTLYVSPEFANSVSGSGPHSSSLRAFALRLTVMLFFGLFPRIQYPFFGRGSRRGQRIRV